MSAPLPDASPPQIDALTGLRGIAAWMVVFYHARLSLADWAPPLAIDLAAHGYLAVDLFFLLSGFVMWLNYAPRFAADGWRAAPRFWWKRFARIWPLHAAILLALVCFALIVLATGRDGSNYPFTELPLHLLLVQNWGLTPDLSWNHPAWSISTEAAAYLLFPFAVMAMRGKPLHPFVAIGVLLTLAATLHLAFASADAHDLGDRIAQLGLLRCVLEFGMGMMLAQLWQQGRDRSWGALVAAFTSAALLAAWIALTLPQVLAVPLVFSAALLMIALDRGVLSRFFASRPLVALGDWSYATYLAHFPLFILAKLLLAGEDLQVDTAGFAGYCLVLLALSAALYRWLEKPAQHYLNRASPRLAQRSAEPAK